jgi:hypothetical protein
LPDALRLIQALDQTNVVDRPGSDLLSLCLNIRDTNGRAPIEKRN